MKKTLAAKVFGRVQGVSFRIFILNKALQLNLNGITENLLDGSVKVEVEGEEKNLLKLIECIKKGPLFSKVIKVDYKISECENKYSNFIIIRKNSFLKDQIKSYSSFLKSIMKKNE